MSDPKTLLLDSKQALLTAIIDSSEYAIISNTHDGLITSWNVAAGMLFEYNETEVLGQHISSIIPHAAEFLTEVLFVNNEREARDAISFEATGKAKSGKDISLSIDVAPLKDKNGCIAGSVLKILNTSLHKRNAANHGMLAAIVNNSDDVIISKTLKGMITSWNRAAEKLFEFSEAEALNQHISIIIPEDRIAEEEYIISEISKGHNVAHFETIRISKTGKRIPISLTISPLIGNDGKVMGASKIARDISEKLAVLEEKERLYKEVKLLSEKKDEFIAMTAHELKTPLTSLSGFLQILETYNNIDEKNAKLVRKCVSQIEKLSMLINDLLEFSKMRTGKLQLRYETFDLVTLIKDVLETYVESQSCKILFHAKNPLLIEADPLRIEQVFVNLITNAIKYSPEGGNIEIQVEEKDGQARVLVKDEGIGIRPEFINKLFSQFYRAVEPAYGIPGLGMGLYITRQIIERHNGTINVESERGKGSVFEFVLPLSVNENV